MPDDLGQPVPADSLRVEAGYVGSEVMIALEGEFDLGGTELFWAHVSEALDSQPQSIVVDATGLAFIDSAVLMAVWRARDAAHAAGVAFRVATPRTRYAESSSCSDSRICCLASDAPADLGASLSHLPGGEVSPRWHPTQWR
jgi:anti-anti-sigma factor